MTVLPPRLAEVLDRPPAGFSPAAIWWWSGEPLDRARLRWQLERFVAGGVRNLIILNLAPSGPMFGSDADEPAFFSEAWWELLDGVCADAEELGAFLWFYDQLGFSGADIQARLVQETPSYAGQWLDRRDGGVTVTTRGFDYLSADACAALIDRVHGEFERRLPHRLGTVIVGSFQDELPALPTWSPAFAGEFERRRGYDPAPYLPALWAGETGADGSRFRRDYHRTRAELAEEAFFRPLSEWHERHGLLHGCDQQDPARAGDPVEGVRLYADYARTHRWFGAPGSDHHGDARIHSSLAHLYGRPRTWIEAFHSSGWGGTLEETFDWLLPWLRSGATLYNPHAVYYTTKGGWWEWAPPSTDWRQPYWRHHRVFADAVTRLCAALSLGHHLCDVAVLLPTATAQAGARLDGMDDDAARADRVYRELVGDMAWFHTVPGALDRLRLDADVIDDDSVRRATVSGGRLRVADEAYAAIVLPACTVLEGETARRLEEFAAGGGRLVAVGALPERGVGDADADRAVARLRARLEDLPGSGVVGSAGDLGSVLGDPGPVDAPVPALVREVEGATVVFLTAAFPRASDVSVGRPDERGIELGWLDVSCDFDPDRYHREMRVRVRGARGPALLVDPFGGPPRRLAAETRGDVTEVVVPFDRGPAVLLVFPAGHAGADEPDDADSMGEAGRPGDANHAGGDDGPGAAVPDPAVAGRPTAWLDLGTTWEMELIPTLDDTWGDFARPAGDLAPVQRWELRHRLEQDGEDGRREEWATASGEEPGWAAAHATFGPHGVWTTSAGAGDDAAPGPPWRPAVYSATRGIRKDPVHRETLGPKGHVPEEFLDFGEVRGGRTVCLRADLVVREPVEATLAVGAAAAKSVRVDGVELPIEDHGYLATAPISLSPGTHPLDLRLTPTEDLRLRAYVTFAESTEMCRRPEWIAAAGPSHPDTSVALAATVTLDALPARAVLQVAAVRPCAVRVNGVQVGRQGGFDPYAEHDAPRVRRYEIADALHLGDNEISLEPAERGEPAAVLADTDFGVATGPSWRAVRDGVPVPTVACRRQHGDPAALHLWRRPHPLPGAAWLENTDANARRDRIPAVVPAVPGRGASPVEWFRFAIPPGAVRIEADVHGAATVFVDGVERATTRPDPRGAPVRVTVGLSPDGRSGVRAGALRIRTEPGFEGGAALGGPIRFTAGTGRVGLGDWEDNGLAEYSGGVRYRCRFVPPPEAGHGRTRAVLDLGRVRGTAEVTLNGRAGGVRVCSPYVFDVTESLRDGENTIEIDVFGTLAPYVDAAGPTHFVFPGQRRSGMFGPVGVRWS
ncbi:hypothetical protein NE236_02435 [Actinoallomurus purpureus]|uniref:glycosyl hydrolase n=1 Tax=Actinoallomurus purpureus TaxID=478114 RepID=UPI002092B722|nr:glycosyl hydrolase [Actinoallomurus purpureus]MCO6003827.1 hypothetical protein [Actinoallomurus purpureus]